MKNRGGKQNNNKQRPKSIRNDFAYDDDESDDSDIKFFESGAVEEDFLKELQQKTVSSPIKADDNKAKPDSGKYTEIEIAYKVSDAEAKIASILNNKALMKQLTSYEDSAKNAVTKEHITVAMSYLTGNRKYPFDKDEKKLSDLINSLQQLAFKLKHDTVTKSKMRFFQSSDRQNAQKILKTLGPIVDELGKIKNDITALKAGKDLNEPNLREADKPKYRR